VRRRLIRRSIQIAALITQKMTEYNVPGVAFGVVKDGKVTARGFGVTNVDNPQPVTPDTIFALASISKTVTTTAIMRLVEQGKVDLNAPVRKYLPDFKLQDESAAASVAIWHLLTHTPGWEGQLTPADKGVDTLAAFVDTMKGPAAARAARWRVELQQRRLQRGRPRH
jgi:CubicO group peptidase (beta-lactamase class C family)